MFLGFHNFLHVNSSISLVNLNNVGTFSASIINP